MATDGVVSEMNMEEVEAALVYLVREDTMRVFTLTRGDADELVSCAGSISRAGAAKSSPLIFVLFFLVYLL